MYARGCADFVPTWVCVTGDIQDQTATMAGIVARSVRRRQSSSRSVLIMDPVRVRGGRRATIGEFSALSGAVDNSIPRGRWRRTVAVRPPDLSRADDRDRSTSGGGMYPMATPSQPRTAAAPEPEPIALAAPPRLAESPPMAGSAAMILVPAASGLGAVVLAVTHPDRPLYAIAGLAVLAASIAAGLGMVISSRTGARRRTREQRERYLDHLEDARVRARAAAARQRERSASLHPDPGAAASMAWIPARRWERRPGDADFLVVRAGLGTVPLASAPSLRADEHDPLTAYDEVCLTAAEELAARYRVLADQPICVSLTPSTVMTVAGDPARVVSVTRALLAQLVWAHRPVDVAVLVCGPDTWDWLKWLPHTLADRGRDGPLPLRLLADEPGPAA